MGIGVSDEFKALWRQKSGRYERLRIGYKRRYWNGAAFVNEASFTYLKEDEVAKFGRTPMSLDVPFKNIFKIANVTFVFHNRYNEWLETTVPPSIFALDSTATVGYKFYRTIFQLQIGYKLSSGSMEWAAVYTGLGLKPKITGKSATAQIPTAGFLHKLEHADAEEVADSFTQEDCIPATGDGSNVDFESTTTGVDHLTDFQVNAVSQTKGSGYKTSNANSIVSAGDTGRIAITASGAPANGETVKCSGVNWKRDNSIETLLGLLFDEAGIASADRTIANILFLGGTSGSKTMDVQAEWEAGTTIQNITTLGTLGSILAQWILIDTFSDGDFTADPAWSFGSIGTYSIVSGAFRIAHQGSDGSFAFAFLIYFRASASADTSTVTFKATAEINSTSEITVRFFWTTVGDFGIRFDDGGNAFFYRDGVGDIQDLGAFSTGTAKEYRVTRTSANVFEVFVDGVSKIVHDAGAGTLATGYFWVHLDSNSDPDTDRIDIDDIYWSTESIDTAGPLTTAHVWESEEFDLLTAPTSWGALDITETLNGGTITYETNVSDTSGSGFDGWTALGGGNQIASNLKRYLKVRATIVPLIGGFGSPEVKNLVANFTSIQVFISLANHSEKNCLQQAVEYIKLADYELSVAGDGHISVQAKATSAEPIAELTQENGILEILEYDTGIPDRVKNVGRVRHGGFASVYDGTSASEASPTSEEEYGRLVQPETLVNLLANDVDLSASRAQSIYENNRRSATDARPPVRIRFRGSIIPWAELSDVLRLWYFDNPIMRRIQANDPLIRPGPYFTWGAPGNILSNGDDWKILSYNPDYDSKDNSAEYFVEEVL